MENRGHNLSDEREGSERQKYERKSGVTRSVMLDTADPVLRRAMPSERQNGTWRVYNFIIVLSYALYTIRRARKNHNSNCVLSLLAEIVALKAESRQIYWLHAFCVRLFNGRTPLGSLI